MIGPPDFFALLALSVCSYWWGDTTPHWVLRLWIFVELIGTQPDMLLEEFAER